MKKLMFAAAVLTAGFAMAESIESTQIVGYNTINVVGYSTTGLSVQFKGIGADIDAGVLLKDVVKVAKPAGAKTCDTTADQIWIYENGAWTKYYFWSFRGAGNVWINFNLHPGTIGTAEEAIAAETDTKLKPGQSFFFVRGGSSASDVTLAGEVVPLTKVLKFSVVGYSTTAMAYPWPTDLAINDFAKFVDDPAGAKTCDTTADQIWVYGNGDWTKYYYWSFRGTGNVWIDFNLHPGTIGTAEEAIAAKTDDKLLPGQAFFFVRGGSKAAVISFDTGLDQ